MQPSLLFKIFTYGHHAALFSCLHPTLLDIFPIPHHLAISHLSFQRTACKEFTRLLRTRLSIPSYLLFP